MSGLSVVFFKNSFNQICLPNYTSYELFEKCLQIALKEGIHGFGLV